jgi:predicted Zn-dependent peptidase
MGLAPENRQKAIATVERELEKIKRKNVGSAELKRVKEFLIGNFKLSHENVKSKMFFYATSVLLFGKVVHPSEQIDGIGAVTAADIRNLACKILVPDNRSISIVSSRQS